MIFLRYFLIFFEETIYFAPLFKALEINLAPSLFFPLIVKNKLSFFISLESIYNP